jgi:hypothetical protein
LGTINDEQAIVHILKTNFDIPQGVQEDDEEARLKLGKGVKEIVSFEKVVDLEDNDIVSTHLSIPHYLTANALLFRSTVGHKHGGLPPDQTQTPKSPSSTPQQKLISGNTRLRNA